VLLGEAWKGLPREEREQYSQRAKVMADEQKKLYPDCWKRKRSNAGASKQGASSATPTTPSTPSEHAQFSFPQRHHPLTLAPQPAQPHPPARPIPLPLAMSNPPATT